MPTVNLARVLHIDLNANVEICFAVDADINYDFCVAVVADGDVVKVKKTEVRQARSWAPLGPQSLSLLDFYSL